SPSAPYEQRMEAFSPPYLCAGPRPEIVAAPTQIEYGRPFDIVSAGAPDRAVLIRTGTATHGNHMDQRMVELVIDGDTITGPPNAAIAPPGDYLLFVLAGGVPSVARFVRLVDAPVALTATGRVGSWAL